MRLPTFPFHRRGSIRAATWIEVLAVVVALLFLAGLMVPVFTRSPRRASRIKCVNNLKNLGLALRIFATDTEGKFPWMIPDAKGGSQEDLTDESRIWRHFQVLSYELSTPKSLQCPTDTNIPTTGNPDWVFRPTRTNDINVRQLSHNDHVSYFLTTGFAEQANNPILAGDRNLTRNGQAIRGQLRPATNDVFGFTKPGHHEGGGNLLFGDGSVQQVSSSEAAQTFSAGLAPIGTNPPPTILIP